MGNREWIIGNGSREWEDGSLCLLATKMEFQMSNHQIIKSSNPKSYFELRISNLKKSP
jgi:hypothetical protein